MSTIHTVELRECESRLIAVERDSHGHTARLTDITPADQMAIALESEWRRAVAVSTPRDYYERRMLSAAERQHLGRMQS